MSRIATASVVTWALAVTALADYPAGRRAAVDLVNAGKNEEALAAFLELAGGPEISPVQRSDALEQAVVCAITLARYEQAAQLVEQFGDAPAAKMSALRLLMAQRDWQAVVDRFRDENFAAWPQHLVGEAFQSRGQCALFTQNGELAAADFAKAAANLIEPNRLGLAFLGLGDAYVLLDDDARALEAYRGAYAAGTVYKACNAAVCAARVLKRQGKLDDAIRELDTIDVKPLEPGGVRDMWLVERENRTLPRHTGAPRNFPI